MTSTHIVIVNYNAGDWLTRSIKSALMFSNGKVTVVDNLSTDNSVELAQAKFNNEPRLEWILNNDNRGFAAANNQVLERHILESCTKRSSFTVLMNPDCELNADTLPRIFNAFIKEPFMGLASCQIFNQDGSMQSSCRRRFPTPWSAFVRLLQLHRLFPNNPKFVNFDYGDDIQVSDNVEFVEAISGAFMVVRDSALNDVGLLDDAYFMHCEDLDWCKRFEQSPWKVGFVSCASVIHAKGISTQSRPIGVLWTLHKGMMRFFDKFYKDQTPWFVRGIVTIGIVCSFLMRSLLSILMSVRTGLLK